MYVQGRAVETDADPGDPRVAITGGSESGFVVSDRTQGEQAAAVLRRGRRRYYSGGLSILLGLLVVAGAWVLF